MAGSSFDVALWVTLFLFSIWAGGRAFKVMKLPPILGQLLMGVLFGPQVFDVVPYASNGLCESIINPEPASPTSRMLAESSGSGSGGVNGSSYIFKCIDVHWERWESGGHIKSIWQFIGEIGVTLMIFESGMHIHFEKVAQIGKKALWVAVVGTALPFFSGWLIVGGLFGMDNFFPSGFAAGCAFAPTSVGISIFLLEDAKMLNSMAGQTTLTAAFIDDVFSLVMLVILTNLAKGELGPADVIVPIIGSFCFLGLSVFLAIKVFPHLQKLLDKAPTSKYASIKPRDELHLFIMVFVLALFGLLSWLDGFIGSHLLGAFSAGMCFVNVPRSMSLWTGQFKRIVKWAVRIFFAASVGFSIPVRKMLEPRLFGYGVILAIGPVLLSKIISGMFAGETYKSAKERLIAQRASWATKCIHPQKLLVGMAMCARAEFAYLVANEARLADHKTGSQPYKKMMDEEVYASVMWALVFATIFSPVAFRWALGVYERAFPMERSQSITTDPRAGLQAVDALNRKASAIEHIGSSTHAATLHYKHTDDALSHSFSLRIAGKFHWGIHREIVACLYSLGVYVIEAKIHAIDNPDTHLIDNFITSFLLIARGRKLDFDDEKLHEMHHALSETIQDPDSQIIFEACEAEFATACMVEVRVCDITSDHKAVIREMTAALVESGLTIIFSYSNKSFDETSPTSSPNGTPKQVGSPGSKDGIRPKYERRMSKLAETMVVMGGLNENPKNKEGAAHVWYANDADHSPHFSETKREETMAKLRLILQNHGIIPKPPEIIVEKSHKRRDSHGEDSVRATKSAPFHGEAEHITIRVIHETEVPELDALTEAFNLTPLAASLPPAISSNSVTLDIPAASAD